MPKGRWAEFEALELALVHWRSCCWERYHMDMTPPEWYSDMVARHEEIARAEPALRTEV